MEQINCPYIAVLNDKKTCKNFPYKDHACHRAKKPVLIKLSYQKSHCFNKSYTQCPGYINGWETGFPKFLQAENNTFLNKILSKLRVRREKAWQKKAKKIEPKTKQAPIAIKTNKTTATKEVQKKMDWSKALAGKFELIEGKLSLDDWEKILDAKFKDQKETEKKTSLLKKQQDKMTSIRLKNKEKTSAVRPRQISNIFNEEEKIMISDHAETIAQDISSSHVQEKDVEREQDIRKEIHLKPALENITPEKLNLQQDKRLSHMQEKDVERKQDIRKEIHLKPALENITPEKLDFQQDIRLSRVQEKDVEREQDITKEIHLKPALENITPEKLNFQQEYNFRDELKSQRHQKKPLKIGLPWQKNQHTKQDQKGLLAHKPTNVKQNRADRLNFFQKIFSRKKKAEQKVSLKRVFKSKAFRLVSLLIILIIMGSNFSGQIIAFSRDMRIKVDSWFNYGIETIEAVFATNTPEIPVTNETPVLSEIARPSIIEMDTQTSTSTLTSTYTSTLPNSGTPGVLPFIYLTQTETPKPR